MIPKEINTDQAPAAVGPYSQAVQIGNYVYTSGTIPLLPDGSMVEGGIKEQTRQIFANLKQVLAAADSSLANVVKTTCFLTDMNDFAEFNEVYAEHFPNFKPARSTVEVSRLPKDVRVEVELIAYVN